MVSAEELEKLLEDVRRLERVVKKLGALLVLHVAPEIREEVRKAESY